MSSTKTATEVEMSWQIRALELKVEGLQKELEIERRYGERLHKLIGDYATGKIQNITGDVK